MKEPYDEDVRTILGKPVDGLVTPPLVYVPELGFRPPEGGLMLPAPVTVKTQGRTLTIDRLVSTSRATEVQCDLVGIEMPWQTATKRVHIALRDESGRAYGPARWWRSDMAIDDGIRRVVSFETLPADLRRIELIASEGALTLSVWLDLVPVSAGGLAVRQPVEAVDTKHGVSVRVRGVAFSDTATVIDLEAEAVGGIRYVRGIGALFGIRRDETKLTLKDDQGRVLTETNPTLPPRDPMGRSDVAVFPAVPSDAHAFELEIPFVYAEEEDGVVEFTVPVDRPREVQFGTHTFRILGSRALEPDPRLAQSQDPRRAQPAIAIDLDLGDWHDDRRLLQPGRVLIDGSDHGFRWTPEPGGGPTNAQQVSYVAVPINDTAGEHTVTFRYPTVHLRGPWRIRFSRP